MSTLAKLVEITIVTTDKVDIMVMVVVVVVVVVVVIYLRGVKTPQITSEFFLGKTTI